MWTYGTPLDAVSLLLSNPTPGSMRHSHLTPLVLAATALLAAAHERHFAGHPEWDGKWPDPPSLSDLGTGDGAPPDLSGVWHGSPKAGDAHRYFFTPSGGGYGSAKDRHAAFAPAAAPGTSYDVACLTSDWNGGKAGGCGWDRATVVVAPSGSTAEARRRALDGVEDAAAAAAAAGLVAGWTATVSFFTGDGPASLKKGAVDALGASIAMDLPWNRFDGNLSGLWASPKPGPDYYVMAHDATSGTMTVWWDTAESPAGPWSSGSGTEEASAGLRVTMNFTSSGHGSPFTQVGNASADGMSLQWSTAGTWKKHSPQILPSTVHTVHLVFMNHLDIGYTTTINTVNNEYVHDYYTKVAQLADDMRALEGTDRFVYTTHPWLMSLFLDCPCAGGNGTMRGEGPYPASMEGYVDEEVYHRILCAKYVMEMLY